MKLVWLYVLCSELTRAMHVNTRPRIRTLLIDNYDSYTYNIWQLLADVNGAEPIVVYNDAFKGSWKDLTEEINFDNIVISPGPGSPDKPTDFGICKDAILQSKVPLLGVCLGHQGICYAHGGDIVRAKEPMHGRLSKVKHNAEGIFDNIPQDFNVVRYHSLVTHENLPNCLHPTAWTSDNVIMGLEHAEKPIFGVQFHPESIATEYGYHILSNFRDITLAYNLEKKNEIEKHTPTPKKYFSIPKSVEEKHYKTDVYITGLALKKNISSIDLFSSMYGMKNISFLFDSTSEQESPLCFMGAVDDENIGVGYSHVIEYLGENQIYIRDSYGNMKFENRNIFEYLEKERNADNNVNIIIDRDSIGTSDAELPFSVTSAWFGYIGYECRHDAERIMTCANSTRSSYNYNTAGNKDENILNKKWSSSQPAALLMHPSQYLVHDSANNFVYVVSIATEDNTVPSPARERSKRNAVDLKARIREVTESSPNL